MAVMRGGRLAGAQPLPARAVALAASPVATAPGDADVLRYGLGFRVVEKAGRTEVGHYGGGAGYGAVVRMVPAAGVAVIILANRSNALFDGSATMVLDRLVPRAAAPSPTASGSYPRAAARGAGRYRNMLGDELLEFVADSGALALLDDDEKIPLYQTGPRTVAILGDDGRVEEQFVFVPARGGVRPYVFFVGRAFMKEEPPRR
jgi:CubicO group peptidase (beta-lactamase class C family)